MITANSANDIDVAEMVAFPDNDVSHAGIVWMIPADAFKPLCWSAAYTDDDTEIEVLM